MNNHKVRLNLIILTSFFCSISGYRSALADEKESTQNPAKEIPVFEPKESSGTSSDFSESFLGIFVGNVQTADSTVTTERTCLFCSAPLTATQEVQFKKSNLTGIRGGKWGENFGYAIEFSITDTNNSGVTNGSMVSVRYTAMSIIPMLRTSSLEISSQSGVYLYGGLGISLYSSDVDVSFPGQSRISGRGTSHGPITLIGGSLSYARSTFFIERRARQTDLKGVTDELFADTATVPTKTTEIVFGVAYRYY